ncbi:hypothetical protein MBLNU230_g3161t1 [Neophaeotheca triangularis]
MSHPADAQPPLSWETSASSNNPTVSNKLPDQVVTCLENARFLHLATAAQNIPHVSLMNYTYLPSSSSNPTTPNPATTTMRPSSLPSGPTIIMTTNPSSRKTHNLLSNPAVSLLVHDWVSHRPATTNTSSTSPTTGRSSSPAVPRSSLANMLMQMNSAAVSSISATINGEARVLEVGTEEEAWCKRAHLANNTFEGQDGAGMFGASGNWSGVPGDGGRESYIEDDEVRVVVVRVRDGRISDWKGGVRDWVVRDEEGEDVGGVNGGLVNGVA